jgi:hypothetical protein
MVEYLGSYLSNWDYRCINMLKNTPKRKQYVFSKIFIYNYYNGQSFTTIMLLKRCTLCHGASN